MTPHSLKQNSSYFPVKPIQTILKPISRQLSAHSGLAWMKSIAISAWARNIRTSISGGAVSNSLPDTAS